MPGCDFQSEILLVVVVAAVLGCLKKPSILSSIDRLFLLTSAKRAHGEKPEAMVQAAVDLSNDDDAKTWWIIDPHKATWTAYWDLITTSALLYTAIVTPVEVSFIPSPPPDETYSQTLFWVNRCVDLIFITDMILQFRLAVRVTGVNGTRWLRKPAEVAAAYVVSKWFWLDAFSVCTSIFDFPIFDESGGAKNLIILRAVRILRLAKLIRLARGSRSEYFSIRTRAPAAAL